MAKAPLKQKWGAVRTGLAAAIDAATDGKAADEAASVTLHPLKQKEVLRLYGEFKAQHAAGICRVPRFQKLLRLKFPTESKAHVAAMVRVVMEHEEGIVQAEAEAEARKRDVDVIFDALDTDGRGTIDLDEFCQLTRTTKIPRAQLRAIFTQRDTDGSGALDLEEFKALVEECKLFEHMDAIVQHAEARRTEQRGKQELWRIGLPAEVKKAPREAALGERPSLAGVSQALVNMRKAMKGASGVAGAVS